MSKIKNKMYFYSSHPISKPPSVLEGDSLQESNFNLIFPHLRPLTEIKIAFEFFLTEKKKQENIFFYGLIIFQVIKIYIFHL